MPAFVFGRFRLDPAERRLVCEGRPVALTPKVFDTLAYLVERGGHLVEKDELMRRLWPDTVVEEVTLARSISSLRKVLGDTPEDERYIETVSKRGYRFVAAVAEVPSDGHLPADPAGAEHSPVAGVSMPGGGTATSVGVVSAAARGRFGRAFTLAALSVVSLGALALGLGRRVPAAGMVSARFLVTLPEGVVPARTAPTSTMALSPDGRQLVITALTRGKPMLRVRPLDRLEDRLLEGTEGAASPFWSPEGKVIAFFAGGKLKKMALGGGPPDTVCDAEFANAGTWGPDGTILFTEWSGGHEGLYRVSAEGGAAQPVHLRTSAGPEVWIRWPAFLPDGRRFVYLGGSSSRHAVRSIAVATIDSPVARHIAPADSQPVPVAGGRLLFVREGTLLVQGIDPDRARLVGDPVPVADLVWYLRVTGSAEFTASADGRVVAYRAPPPATRLAWVDRAGSEVGALDPPGFIDNPRLSHDGSRVAFDVGDPRTGVRDVWIHDLKSGVRSRVTADPLDACRPIWSPDGERLLHGSASSGPLHMRMTRADGSGGTEELLQTSGVQFPMDWSRDGRFVLFGDQSPARRPQRELWLLPLEGESRPRPLEPVPASRSDGRFSPDGRWVAFVSEETGRPEVFVTPLDGRGRRRQISRDGGVSPRWRGDGRELFYVTHDGEVMAVPLRPGPQPDDASTPRRLFRLKSPAAWGAGSGLTLVKYEVDARGERFLCLLGPEAPPAIAVAIGWDSLARD